MQPYKMQLSAAQVRRRETSDWPEDAVADLVDRVLRAKYGEVDPSVDKAWHAEIGRRIDDLETGKVQGIPLEDIGKSAQYHRPVKVVPTSRGGR
jgi:hypothetical protein